MIYYSDLSLPPVHSFTGAAIKIPGASELGDEEKTLYPATIVDSVALESPAEESQLTNYFDCNQDRYLTFEEINELLDELDWLRQKPDVRQPAACPPVIVQRDSGGGLIAGAIIGGLIGYETAKKKFCPHCGGGID